MEVGCSMGGDNSSAYVASRRIGDATVTVISEGFSLAPHGQIHPRDVPELAWREAIPEANGEGSLPLGVNVVHITLEEASILVDAGVEDPQSPWGREAAATYGITRTPGVVAGLRSIGIAPEGITHVLITHAHSDHFAGAVDEWDGLPVPRFPNARYLLHIGD
jgi:glyoxylase-like metal-dependent hydrolase (beta-lactamase superfamily II)